MSLRWRVALALAALAAATTLTVGVIGYVTTRNRLVQEVDRSLELAGKSLEFRPGGIELPRRGLLDVYVQTLRADGEPVDSTWDTTFSPGADSSGVVGQPREVSFETVDTEWGNARIRTEGLPGGAFQVARSMQETDAVLADLRWRSALLVGVVSLIAALIGWVLARSVAAPLSRLTDAATDVQQSGRLDVEVPASGRSRLFGRDEVGRLGAAFNGMLGALASSRAEQQRLVEDAGHELRTPLTSVRTNVAVLRRHPDLDDGTRAKVLDDLHAETEELVELVEEVVALARGAADDAAETTFRLGDAAVAVAERARRRHDRAVEVLTDDSSVTASVGALERAISNLVDNAAKFDDAGGPIEIVVEAGRVTVFDRGPGIGPDDAPRVFDRFYRAAGARSRPGSGLGLSIVREIAERSGGAVFAAQRDGGGASVGLWLPPARDLPPPPTPSDGAPAVSDA